MRILDDATACHKVLKLYHNRDLHVCMAIAGKDTPLARLLAIATRRRVWANSKKTILLKPFLILNVGVILSRGMFSNRLFTQQVQLEALIGKFDQRIYVIGPLNY